MEKPFALPIIAAILIMALVLPGCVSTSEDDGATQQPNGEIQPGQGDFQPGQSGFQGRNYTGPRGNFTGRPNGNFSNQFMQEAIAACSGKTQGDNCTVTNTRGEMPGNCEARNATLECRPQFANRQKGSQAPEPPVQPPA